MSRPQPYSSVSHDHAPVHPSGLRQSHTAASYSSLADAADAADAAGRQDSPPLSPMSPPPQTNDRDVPGLSLAGPSRQQSQHQHQHHDGASEHTPLLGSELLDFRETAHEGPCNHGTFSPRPMSPTDSLGADPHFLSGSESDGSLPALDAVMSESSRKRRSWKKQLTARMKSKKMSTSSILAKRHGLEDSTLM